MQQPFIYHPLAGRTAKPQSHAARLTDAATEYFAYIALVTIAVAIAVMTMAASANVAFNWLDKIAKPGYFDSDDRVTSSPPNTNAPAVMPIKREQFAMLPAAMPLAMKDDVIRTNY